MAKSKVFTTNVPAGAVSFNVVPLVDCAFLMILFFILTSQIANPNLSILHLATPTGSQAQDADKEKDLNKVIVNVISAEVHPDKNRAAEEYLDPTKAGEALRYEINNERIDLKDTQTLVQRITREKKAALAKGVGEKDFYVVIRSDWRVKYEDVINVFAAAAEAKVPKMNITVMKSKG
ncbi:MAG: ExbD/TolR family protein [Phycisphaerae bacterium]